MPWKATFRLFTRTPCPGRAWLWTYKCMFHWTFQLLTEKLSRGLFNGTATAVFKDDRGGVVSLPAPLLICYVHRAISIAEHGLRVLHCISGVLNTNDDGFSCSCSWSQHRDRCRSWPHPCGSTIQNVPPRLQFRFVAPSQMSCC